MITKEEKVVTKDPICGMTVDEKTALHTVRNGKTFYFCSESCQKKFLSNPTGEPSTPKAGCCG